MAASSERGVPLSTLSPKFLHSNSTSHTWPFSAIAELIDNAYDPDVSAKQFWIDKTVVKGEQCLCFMDNGNGLDNQTMHKMLSFGYSDKTAINGLEPIGIYGNGFKSGSMRLGRDAIVFSKSMTTSCVGMLSQTYLEKIEANQIIVPIVCLETQENNNRSVLEEYKASLQDILQYSPFKTLEELLTEIDAISQQWSSTRTGTRIIIWNLRRTSSGTTEFDFENDRYDIRIPSEIYETMNKSAQHVDSVNVHTPESVFSLRAYCSILYLKPRMQIIVRGVKVKSQLIAKSLAWIRKDHYRPIFLNNNRVPIIFGYNTKSKDQYGIMMYHKNRLIKAYERVGCQLKANNKGVGVIGVIECNFLEPTHNKQSFLETDKYRKTMASLGIKLEEYWREICFRKSKENPNSIVPVEDTVKQPDQNWVQCDECLQWRKLPDGIDCSLLPDKWFCRLNPDPQFRSCEMDEEPEDSDDDQPYRKTYKVQEREDRRKQMADEQKRQEQQRLAEHARKTGALQQHQQDRRQSLRAASPSTPLTPRNRSLQGGAVRAESSPQLFSNISQAACSPSSSSGLPVITNVCSLSVDTQSRKRKHPISAQASTNPEVNSLPRSSCGAPTALSVSSASSPAVPIPSDDDDDDTDDDIFILENASTPKPKQTAPKIKKVKSETDQSEVEVSMLLDCTDDAAMDVTLDVEGAHSAAKTEKGAGSLVTAPTKMTTSTTQTEMSEVKQEVLSQDSTKMDPGALQSREDSAAQRCDSSSCSVQKTAVKQENQEDRGQQVSRCGAEREEKAGPSHAHAFDITLFPADLDSISKLQEQQDRLVELMETTAKERDSLKEQVDQLTLRLVDCTNVNVKKECSHKASQTDVTEEMNYKHLFEKARQKVDKLIKDKEVLLSACQNKSNPPAGRDKPGNIDEIVQQVENLLRELDQTNKDKEELASQVQSLEDEKTRLSAKCEELRLMLQHPRDEQPTTSASSARPRPEEEGQASNSDRYSDTFRSLIQLRHNIGRYLVPRVPALDLEQVNFECNVIDEILEQLLSP